MPLLISKEIINVVILPFISRCTLLCHTSWKWRLW